MQRAIDYKLAGKLAAIEEPIGGRPVDLVVWDIVDDIWQLVNVEIEYVTNSSYAEAIGRLANQATSALQGSERRYRVEFIRTKTDQLTKSAAEIVDDLSRLGVDTTRVDIILFP